MKTCTILCFDLFSSALSPYTVTFYVNGQMMSQGWFKVLRGKFLSLGGGKVQGVFLNV